jgi:hypothetical protein
MTNRREFIAGIQLGVSVKPYEAVNFSHRKQDTYPIRLKL